MVCYHPLKAWPVGLTDKNKTKYRITSYNTDHIEIDIKNNIKEVYDNTVSPYADQVLYEFKEIPCGHCIGCRLDYSRQWADRCMLEMKQHKQSYFVTLTYNDEHLPLNQFIDIDSGECHNIASLQKRDFQLFMKRLRKNYKFNNKLRFFAAGEYGDKSLRPHYHAIIFGLVLDDLELYSQNALGQSLYTSKFMESVWPYGFVVIAPASWETCAYVARYMLKKQKGESSDIYEKYNFEPEFSLMSRKPGLGREFWNERGSSMFDTDCIYISTPDGGRKFYPSRYYKKLFEAFDEEQFLRYKDLKELANRDICEIKSKSTSKTYLDMLETEENIRKVACKALKRTL